MPAIIICPQQPIAAESDHHNRLDTSNRRYLAACARSGSRFQDVDPAELAHERRVDSLALPPKPVTVSFTSIAGLVLSSRFAEGEYNDWLGHHAMPVLA
jgi:hypothetical protein